MKTFRSLAVFGSLTLILFSVVTAVAATNTIPVTNLDYRVILVGPNDIKPSACAGIYVSNLITGSGVITGTGGNDLILASPGVDMIDGSGGNDCILGGSEDDIITGGFGTDACIGNAGTDTFLTCENELQ
jgi:Ca2+-binding RTX toxin-like protein